MGKPTIADPILVAVADSTATAVVHSSRCRMMIAAATGRIGWGSHSHSRRSGRP